MSCPKETLLEKLKLLSSWGRCQSVALFLLSFLPFLFLSRFSRETQDQHHLLFFFVRSFFFCLHDQNLLQLVSNLKASLDSKGKWRKNLTLKTFKGDFRVSKREEFVLRDQKVEVQREERRQIRCRIIIVKDLVSEMSLLFGMKSFSVSDVVIFSEWEITSVKKKRALQEWCTSQRRVSSSREGLLSYLPFPGTLTPNS